MSAGAEEQPEAAATDSGGSMDSSAELQTARRRRVSSAWQRAGRQLVIQHRYASHLDSIKSDAQEYLGLERTYTRADADVDADEDATATTAATAADANSAELADVLSTSSVVSTVARLERDFAAVHARPCFLMPNSKRRVCWDLYTLILLCYVSAIVPYRLGFNMEPQPWEFAFIFECFVDVSFIADLIANFRTARFDSMGNLVHEPRDVARSYLRGWFCVDFLSCLPVGYIRFAVDDSGSKLGHTKLLKVLRMLRVAKMLRLTRLTRMLQRHTEDLQAFHRPLAVLKIGAIAFFTSHVIACMWFAIGLASTSATPSHTSWLDHTELVPLANSSVHEQYVTSLYWATLTLALAGCPDVMPVTTVERCFTTFTVLLGVCTLMVFLADLASVALRSVLDPVQMEQNRKLSLVRDYLQRNRVPTETRTAIRCQLLHSFDEYGVVDEAHVLSLMPVSKAEDLVRSIHGEAFHLLKTALGEIFRDNDPILLDLVVTLRPERLKPGEVVYRKGDVGNAMYLVLDGCCQHEEVSSSDYELLERGSCFGDDSILHMADGPDGRERTSTVRVCSEASRGASKSVYSGSGAGCKLGVLRRESLRELFVKHPNMEAKLTRGYTRRIFKAKRIMWHFFLSHKQANGGNTVASLHAALREKHVLSWYDNDSEDRSEEGMMQGVRRSAVFLLFLTEGAMSRPFVQKELKEAFRQRKPMVLLYETDKRYGAADIYSEADAQICVDEVSGCPILTREQIEWFFGQLVGVPYRREKHEQGPMLDKIVLLGKLAAAGRASTGAKIPPEHLVNPPELSTATVTDDAELDNVHPRQPVKFSRP